LRRKAAEMRALEAAKAKEAEKKVAKKEEPAKK